MEDETAASLLDLLHQDQDVGQLASLLETDASIISTGTPTSAHSFYASFSNSEHTSYAPTPQFTFEEEDADEDQEGSEEEQQGPSYPRYASNRDPYYGQARGDFDDEDAEDVMPGNMEKMMSAAIGADGDMSWAEVQAHMEEFDDELKFATGVGKRKNKKGAARRRRDPNITPEIEHLLGEANSAYLQENYGVAIEKLQEVIRMSPNVPKAWRTLAMIQETLGNEDKSLQLYLCAAHLTPKDAELWKRLGLMSRTQGLPQQAIYCYSRAIQRDRDDVDALWDRSYLYAEQNRPHQAIEGFRKILTLLPYNMAAVKELTQVYIGMNNFQQAITLFEEAVAYHERIATIQGNIDAGTSRDTEGDEAQVIGQLDIRSDTEPKNGISFSELNILAELYMMASQYGKAIEAIKRGVRRLQNRTVETWWDAVDDDSEYDDVGRATSAQSGAPLGGGTRQLPGGGGLPIELRVRLGQCRIMLGQVATGKAHLKYLWKFTADMYPDLYEEAAETFVEKQLYNDAITVYKHIIDCEQTDNVVAWANIALCYRELGNLESAAEFYSNVVEYAADNLDAKMKAQLALAEVYEEMGEEEKAMELLDEVKRSRIGEANEADMEEEASMEAEELAHGAIRSVIEADKASDTAKGKLAAEKAAQEKRERLREQETATRDKFDRWRTVVKWRKRGGALDGLKKQEFLEIGRSLIAEFRNVKQFFPADRAKRYTGTSRYKSKTFGGTIDEQVTTLSARLKSHLQTGEDKDAEGGGDEAQFYPKTFRGIDFDEWFDLFMRFAVGVAMDSHIKEAYDVLNTAYEANVFFHNERRKITTKLFLLAVSLIANDMERVCETCRWLINYRPFEQGTYRIFTMAMASGTEALSLYASSTSTKAILRQVKFMDDLIARGEDSTADHASSSTRFAGGSEENGSEAGGGQTPMSDIRKMRLTTVKKNPVLLTLYGHLLHVARNYLGAVAYYVRAFVQAPKDPMINLSLGLAYLHRAMQRQTDNRHLQIAQGFTFLFRYYEIRGGDKNDELCPYAQEATYNIARAFHQLGLGHLAVPYYEKVLALPSQLKCARLVERTRGSGNVDDEAPEEEEEDDSDLSREAAYNLSTIYVASGSMGLAQDILMRYCTI